MRKLIALDFDGVICDSMDECMLVSYYAYFNKLQDKRIDFSDITENFKDDIYNEEFKKKNKEILKIEKELKKIKKNKN